MSVKKFKQAKAAAAGDAVSRLDVESSAVAVGHGCIEDYRLFNNRAGIIHSISHAIVHYFITKRLGRTERAIRSNRRK
jgi:hypothetical protein